MTAYDDPQPRDVPVNSPLASVPGAGEHVPPPVVRPAPVRSRGSQLLRLLGAAAVVLLLAVALWQWKGDTVQRKLAVMQGRFSEQFHQPMSGMVTGMAVGKGVPLADQSSATIQVLDEGIPLNMTGAPEMAAASATVIGGPVGQPTAAVAQPAPQPVVERGLDDVTGLKLGTTLALLTQAYANGGAMARSLANVAADMAQQAGASGQLVDALAILRYATPQAGPLTTLVLTTEVQRVLAMGAPKDLVERDAKAAEAGPVADSWWRRQLARFVTIRRGDEPEVDRWTTQLRLAQEQLARGNASDAQVTLTTDPLSDDKRLDVLRDITKQYLDQQGKLTNAINAYTQAYLQQRQTEQTGAR